MDAEDIALMKSLSAGAAPEPLHINLSDYGVDLMTSVMENLSQGITKFEVAFENGETLCSKICSDHGEIWIDIQVDKGSVYSSLATGMCLDNEDKDYFLLDAKINARTIYGWLRGYLAILYTMAEGTVFVEVTDSPFGS